ncbi:MAG TPA: septal ring lytic transglycosylase RlpA family protein [Caulobacteraceae bacterium]|nr:septal ring lytic transglycosylase RlpA family protein [Caulobacteraceae bacterium]
MAERRDLAGRLGLIALAGLTLAACATTRPPNPMAGARSGVRGTMKPYEVGGVWYTPRAEPGYDRQGLASWYGQQFHHRMTADGEAFDMDVASAAHKTLPLPCIVEVTNLDNGRRIRVRVNDRGPFVGGRIIDMSRQGAKDLGFYDRGTARVRVRYIGPAPGLRGADTVRYAQARIAPPAQILPRSGLMSPSPVAMGGPVGRRPPPALGFARIQVGAFTDRANAERAAARVSSRGAASIEPIDRGGVTLYRVMVSCGAADAGALRDDLTAAGFSGATVIGPS